jgi:SnoaL-like domain
MRAVDPAAALELQNLVGRFANSFDLKEWDRLGECLADNLYTDYHELRGTPPETLSRERFVELRRAALQGLQTQHLSGNLEIELDGGTAHMKVSMLIYRRNEAGEVFDTRCLYVLRAVRAERGWCIDSITQKVLGNEGNAGIHKGIR